MSTTQVTQVKFKVKDLERMVILQKNGDNAIFDLDNPDDIQMFYALKHQVPPRSRVVSESLKPPATEVVLENVGALEVLNRLIHKSPQPWDILENVGRLSQDKKTLEALGVLKSLKYKSPEIYSRINNPTGPISDKFIKELEKLRKNMRTSP
jgi:hypothetical protein